MCKARDVGKGSEQKKCYPYVPEQIVDCWSVTGPLVSTHRHQRSRRGWMDPDRLRVSGKVSSEMGVGELLTISPILPSDLENMVRTRMNKA